MVGSRVKKVEAWGPLTCNVLPAEMVRTREIGSKIGRCGADNYLERYECVNHS